MSDDIYELSAAIGKDVEEIYSKVQAQIQLEMCYEDLPICKMLQLLIKIKNETPELFEPAILFFANSTASFRTIALKYEIPPVTFWPCWPPFSGPATACCCAAGPAATTVFSSQESSCSMPYLLCFPWSSPPVSP